MFKTNKYRFMLHSVALWNSLLQDSVNAKSLLGPKSYLMQRKKVYQQFPFSLPR